MKTLTLLLALLFLFAAPAVDAQSANYRAQARYYSAKRAYEGGQYNDAARMLLESRGLLGGKSNERLQYLLVLSLHRAKRFDDAQAEIRRFFDLLENREQRENYTHDVDRMTADEIRQITMLLDEVDAGAANAARARANAAAAGERAAARERAIGARWEALKRIPLDFSPGATKADFEAEIRRRMTAVAAGQEEKVREFVARYVFAYSEGSTGIDSYAFALPSGHGDTFSYFGLPFRNKVPAWVLPFDRAVARVDNPQLQQLIPGATSISLGGAVFGADGRLASLSYRFTLPRGFSDPPSIIRHLTELFGPPSTPMQVETLPSSPNIVQGYGASFGRTGARAFSVSIRREFVWSKAVDPTGAYPWYVTVNIAP